MPESYENILRFISTKKICGNSLCFFKFIECVGTVHYGSSAPMAPPMEESILCPVVTCSPCILLTPHFYPLLSTSSEHWVTILTKTLRYSCRNLTWGGRGGCAIIRKQILSNLRNRMKPQGWELGRISQMGRSGTVFWGKNSLFRWVLVNIYSYTLQLNQLLRPRSWCVIKEFQKNTTLHDKNTKQNPSLPSASLNTLPNLSFPSFSI